MKIIVPQYQHEQRAIRFLRDKFPKLHLKAALKILRKKEVVEIDNNNISIPLSCYSKVTQGRYIVVPSWLQFLQGDTKENNKNNDIFKNYTIEPAFTRSLTPKKAIEYEKILYSWVIYQDDYILIINKPPGIASHKGSKLKSTEHLETYLHAVYLINVNKRYQEERIYTGMSYYISIVTCIYIFNIINIQVLIL